MRVVVRVELEQKTDLLTTVPLFSLYVTAWFPVKQYLVSSMHRGGPFRTETNEHKPQFMLVYWLFMVSSVCMKVLVAFYQGLPV